jgi:hypothetical protein
MCDLTYNLPEGFDSWSRRKKVAWHQKRVSIEQYSFKYITNLLSALSPEELRESINEVQRQRRAIKATLEILNTAEFSEAHLELKHSIKRVKTLIRERMKISKRRFQRRAFSISKEEAQQINHLKKETNLELDIAYKSELQIKRMFKQAQADPTPFLKLHHLVGVV